RTRRRRPAGTAQRDDQSRRLSGSVLMGRNAEPDQLERAGRSRYRRDRRRTRHGARCPTGRRMRRKPLPKAITRSIANLQQIAAGFAADEQGGVPPHVTREAAAQPVAFDAVEPEPKNEALHRLRPNIAPQGAGAAQPKSRAADPLAARRRALARRIVDRHKNFAAMGGLVPLPAVNIASVTAVNL